MASAPPRSVVLPSYPLQASALPPFSLGLYGLCCIAYVPVCKLVSAMVLRVYPCLSCSSCSWGLRFRWRFGVCLVEFIFPALESVACVLHLVYGFFRLPRAVFGQVESLRRIIGEAKIIGFCLSVKLWLGSLRLGVSADRLRSLGIGLAGCVGFCFD
ncbi:hypothetical protein F2Q69_00016844 [Brassica cretica]|uniref:Transmembrane protein n=1 Tax=Brassica cretica TaxID=69181 RepID=A0A8S9R826_BRACR|nr:hypothetical protein F2Q69_00016844 [Brassica cretica]